MNIETRNAIIENTRLGFEYHDIFTFSLFISYGDVSQTAGGYVLSNNRDNKDISSKLITKILKVVGVNSWEELKGKYIRIKADYQKIYEIGNIIEDKWLNFNECNKNNKTR